MICTQTCDLETKVSGLESIRVRLIKVLLLTRVMNAKVSVLPREPCMKDLVLSWSGNKSRLVMTRPRPTTTPQYLYSFEAEIE